MNIEQKKTLIFKAIWETVVKAPDNEITKTDEWLKCYSFAFSEAFANGIFQCERKDISENQVDTFVKNEINFFKSKNYNFRWKTCETTRPNINGALIENGMVFHLMK